MVRNLLAMSALALGVFLGPPASAQQGDAVFRATTLNLTAQGEIRARPEIANLLVGAQLEAATAQEAIAETNRRTNAAVQALRKAGVSQRDIQTQSVQLNPRYADRSDGPVRIVAYEATSMVSVVVRDVDRAGELLDIAMAAGANQVRGVRYGLKDPETAQRAARDLALQTLQDDAARVADIMGQRVVRLVSVNSHGWGQVMTSGNRIEEIVVTSSRLEPGEVLMRTSVSGVFEIAPR